MKNNMLHKICILSFLCFSLIGYAQNTDNENYIEGEECLPVDLGFGIMHTKEKTTASSYVISGEELKKTSAINVSDALFGRLLGLTALKSGGFSGDNGYGAGFNIRGIQTSTDNNILILVDGLERPIDRLSIDEVESVTVLKDAAAVSLYGYRGINGILSIKTKRGFIGDMTVSASYDHKFIFKPSLPKFVDAYTYANAMNEARANDGSSPAYNKYELDAFKNNNYPLVYPNVDWESETLRDVASENIINVDVRGGNDKVKYFTLINYTDSRGLLNGTETNQGYSTQLKYSKANIRTNLDFTLTPTTDMEVNIQGTLLETNRPSQVDANGVIGALYQVPSGAFPVRTEEGIWGGNNILGGANILAKIQNTGFIRTHARSLYADTKLKQNLDFWLEGLSATARFGYDNYSEIYEDRYRGFAYGNDRYIFDDEGKVIETINFSGGDRKGDMKFNKWLNNQWRRANLVFSLDYKTKLAGNDFQASLFYTYEAYSSSGRNNTFFRNNFSAYAHYDISGKYLADLTLVYSGSNRSYPQKHAFSPTLSLGWLLSKEDFLKKIEAIDFLKLRASAGILHTDYVPLYGLDRDSYEGRGSYIFGEGYGVVWGTSRQYLPTKNFKLETAYKYNLGVDMRLFNSLDFTFEAYMQRRNNILLSADALTSSVLGLASSYINKGVVDSKGIEIGLGYRKTVKDFTLNASAMFTYGTNKLVDNVESPKAYPYLEEKGKSVHQAFGLEAIGFFQDEDDIKNSPNQEFMVVKPGDIKYKDQNGDGVINDNDRIAMGYNSWTPEINYAFSLGMEYKGLGFNILFQGVGNYTKYLNLGSVYVPLVGNQNLSQHYYENRWIPGQDNSHAKYPRLTSEDNPNNYRPSSLWYADASFLKLRNCEIYYHMPASWFNKTFFKGMKIYVKGENLLTIDNIKTIDPELASTAYPVCKAVNIGLSMKF